MVCRSRTSSPEYEEDSGRVGPLGAPVLVRREAAAEAHRYKREMQARLDHRPGETRDHWLCGWSGIPI